MYINYNDIDLTNVIKLYPFENPIMPSRKNVTLDMASMHGIIYRGYKYNEKKYKLKFDIKFRTDEEYENNVFKVIKALSVDSPKKLFLGDKSKYMYAVPEGDVLENKICKGMGSISITFICYDPYKYGANVKLFEQGGVGNLFVNNEGTEEAHPVINISFSEPSYFAQVTSYTGETILVGSRPTVDKPNTSKVRLVLNDPCESTANWLPSQNVVDSGRVVEGNVSVGGDGYFITASDYGNSLEATWHGPAVRRNIGQNITDFELRARIKHNSLEEKSNSTVPPSGSSYEVTASALNLRSGAGTSYKILTSIPKKTKITVTGFSKDWAKTSYKGKNGYVHKDYIKKIDTKKSSSSKSTFTFDSTENKMGRLELYLFDSNGQKLGKIVLRDSEKWYEYTEPEVWIGNKLILQDGKNCPTPKKKTTKDKDGKTTTTVIDSGRFGDWNEYYGDVTIKRTTKNNKQYWELKVTKLKDGKVVKTLSTKTAITSSDYPTGALNHVVLWFGQHKDLPPVDSTGLTDLKVYNLNATVQNSNIINFKAGDELEIDCGDGNVFVNGRPRMDLVDIGSQFFSFPSGESAFSVMSDNKDVYVSTVFEERWL